LPFARSSTAATTVSSSASPTQLCRHETLTPFSQHLVRWHTLPRPEQSWTPPPPLIPILTRGLFTKPDCFSIPRSLPVTHLVRHIYFAVSSRAQHRRRSPAPAPGLPREATTQGRQNGSGY